MFTHLQSDSYISSSAKEQCQFGKRQLWQAQKHSETSQWSPMTAFYIDLTDAAQTAESSGDVLKTDVQEGLRLTIATTCSWSFATIII